jgi:hypothetical protein
MLRHRRLLAVRRDGLVTLQWTMTSSIIAGKWQQDLGIRADQSKQTFQYAPMSKELKCAHSILGQETAIQFKGLEMPKELIPVFLEFPFTTAFSQPP